MYHTYFDIKCIIGQYDLFMLPLLIFRSASNLFADLSMDWYGFLVKIHGYNYLLFTFIYI